MMLPTTAGEKALVSLRCAHMRVVDDLSGVTLNDLWKQLIKANILFADTGTDEQRVEIAQMWLNATKMNMDFNELCFITDNITDDILSIASTRKTMEVLFSNEEYARTLAFACMCAIAETNKGNRRKSNEAVVKAMSVFANKRIIDDNSLTTEAVVTLFYGPMAYALYRTDVDNDNDLIVHLFELNMPLRRELPQVEQAKESNQRELPDDLFDVEV